MAHSANKKPRNPKPGTQLMINHAGQLVYQYNPKLAVTAIWESKPGSYLASSQKPIANLFFIHK